MNTKTVLLTGGTGFLGAAFLKYIAKFPELKVKAIYRNTRGPNYNHVEWCKADINNPESLEPHLEGVDTIIHLAALLSYLPSDREELFKVNVKGTQNLVNAALSHSIQNFIFLSSASAMQRTPDNYLIKEIPIGTPVFYSIYAQTKYLAELECWRGNAEGLNIKILNPSLIIGEQYPYKGSMSVFNNVAAGLSYYPPGNLGLIDVQDVCKILTDELLNENWNIQMLLVAECVSWEIFLKMIAEAMHLNTKWRPLKSWQNVLLHLKAAIKPSFITNKELLHIIRMPLQFDFEHMALHNNKFQFANIYDTINRIIINKTAL